MTLPAVSIPCCTRCNWPLRSARMAQDLLSTFGEAPGSGGIVRIRLDGAPIRGRGIDGGGPA
jgi:selenoprotein W-related protein